jgi:hypothetical protein
MIWACRTGGTGFKVVALVVVVTVHDRDPSKAEKRSIAESVMAVSFQFSVFSFPVHDFSFHVLQRRAPW